MTITELPAEGPIYVGEIAPLRGWPKPDTATLVTRYAAMALVHLRAYTDVILADGPRKATGQQLRDAVGQHWDPAVAAFTAAALLHGWPHDRICHMIEVGDGLEVTLWEWVREGLDVPDDVDDDWFGALIDRLTPIPQPDVPDGQVTIDFTAAARQ